MFACLLDNILSYLAYLCKYLGKYLRHFHSQFGRFLGYLVGDALALKLETEAALVLADSLNLAIVGKESLQYAPQLIDGTAWEPVAVLDVFVSSTGHASENVGYIATVEVGGSTDGKEIEQQVIVP